MPVKELPLTDAVTVNGQVVGSLGTRFADKFEPLTEPVRLPLLPLVAHVPDNELPVWLKVTVAALNPVRLSLTCPDQVPLRDTSDGEGEPPPPHETTPRVSAAKSDSARHVTILVITIQSEPAATFSLIEPRYTLTAHRAARDQAGTGGSASLSPPQTTPHAA